MTIPPLLDRLPARQRKESVFAQAKREQLAPLQAERAALVKSLEARLETFIAGVIPDLEPATLAPFEQAAKQTLLDTGPLALAQKLRHQSETARQLCQRYEREFGIYHLAEYLPEQEGQLANRKSELAELHRSYDRLEVELEPLHPLNEKLAAAGFAPITPETADTYTRSPGSTHYLRLLKDKAYRMAWPVVAQLEAHGERLPDKLRQRLSLQQGLLVKEQATDLCQSETQRQRMWVEAYVLAWTSRLSDRQILAEVRQAMADAMHEPGFRLEIATRLERCYPPALDMLFDKIEALDASARRFLVGFDANYEAGRIEVADELAGRQRTA